MLSYEEFKQQIRERLVPGMGEKYSECVIREMEVNKAGKIKDGFCINPKTKRKKDTVVMPTLYFDDLYTEYLNTKDLESIIDSTVKAMVRGLKDGKQIGKVMDTDKGPEVVIFQVVNTDDYRSLLNDVPHREFMDLAVIYRWAINVSLDGFSSTVITNEMAERYGLCETELFEKAFVNTRLYFPPEVKSMGDIAFTMFMRSGATSREAKNMTDRIPDDVKMYFITNGCSKLGATALLYNDIFQSLSSKLNSDLYVIPLSSAEIMVLPVNTENDIANVMESFKNLNNVQFEDEEYVSDAVYYFDSEMNQLRCFAHVGREEVV